jgi:amidase
MAHVQRLFALMLAAATSYRLPQAKFAESLGAAQQLGPADDSPQARALRGTTLLHRDWLALNEERTRLRWAWHDYFKEYDLLLCPAYPVAAHPHVHDVPTDSRVYRVNGKELSHAHMLFWAGLTGLAYLPATAAPAGFTNGSPGRGSNRRSAVRRPHDHRIRAPAGNLLSGLCAVAGI